jgi:phage/plasmid-like protein (TIGR03299 family)
MAYVGKNGTPWHGLGNPVTDDMTELEMMAAASIDSTVAKYPTFREVGGVMIQIPNRFSLDRDSDREHYDIVSDLYKPVQPERAFSFFKRFVAAGHMKMETAGSLQKGKRIWGLASIQDGFTLKGGDRIKGYLLLHCPYQLGKSFEIKFTTVRAVCGNTVAMALAGKCGYKMSHWNEFDERQIEKAEDVLGIARQQLTTFKDGAIAMSNARITDQQTLEYLVRLTNPKLLAETIAATEAVLSASNGSALDAAIAASTPTLKKITTDDLNRVGKTMLESILSSPGSDLASARGTWWGALNGVTHAIDHVLGRDQDSRLTQAWFGHRADQKQKAYEYALQGAIAATATIN